jgi:Ice-binding-like
MSRSRCRARMPDVAPVNESGRLARLSKKKVGVGLVSILSFTALAIPTSAMAIGTAPSLGTAAPFGVLASSTVTNTGPSTVGGDLGLYPGTSITGFPPGNVLGTIHATDAVAGNAQADTTTAYNTAAGEAPDVVLPSADLTGLTLDPGVYQNGSAVMLDTNGTLTLNGEGNPASVFIFQVGSTLTTGTNSTISYINGAQPCNVFWQVGSSATLGTSSLFVGTILADQSISVSDTVTVNGRLLASNGAVTLIDDTITPSDCATPGTGGSGGSGGTGGTGTGGTGGSGGTGTGGTTTPVTTPPKGTPVTTPSKGTPKSGTTIGSGKAKTAKQRKARLAKQRKARLAKQRKARLAKQRKARLAKQRARHQAAKHPTHHAGFTG